MGLDEFRNAQKDMRPLITQVLEDLENKGEGKRLIDLNEALADRTIGPTAIQRVLAKWGYKVNESAVRRYREVM